MYRTQLENGMLQSRRANQIKRTVIQTAQFSGRSAMHCRGGFIVYRSQLENGTLKLDAANELDLGLVPNDYAQVRLHGIPSWCTMPVSAVPIGNCQGCML